MPQKLADFEATPKLRIRTKNFGPVRTIVDQFLFLGLDELRGELLRTRSPGRFLRFGWRIAAGMSARLLGSDFRYTRLALRTKACIRMGNFTHAARVARKLVATAPSTASRAVARDLLEAVEAGDLERTKRIAAHARQLFGRGKGVHKLAVVSRKYKYFYLSNLKAASRSIFRTLRPVDPEAEVFELSSVDDILLMRPEVRDYFSFAFVRNPFHRALSLWMHLCTRKSHMNLKWPLWQSRYHGLSPEMDFESFCAWLASPYGADEFADRHWLAQHLQIGMPGRMPDFVGRLETAGDDFRTAARRIGLPDLHLLHGNTLIGKEAQNRKDVETAQSSARAAFLTNRARELLRRRYADDFRIFGYDPE